MAWVPEKTPSAARFYRALNQAILAPDIDLERLVLGAYAASSASGTPSQVTISIGHEPGALLGVTTLAMLGPMPTALRLKSMTRIAVNHLMAAEMPQPLTFPFDVRVERRDISLRVNGRRQKWQVFLCGQHAAALRVLNGVLVWVSGAPDEIERHALRHLTRAELARIVKQRDERGAGHGKF